MNAVTLQRLMTGAVIQFLRMDIFGHPTNDPAPVYRIEFGDSKSTAEIAVFYNCDMVWCQAINCSEARASWAVQLITKMFEPVTVAG